MKNLRNRRGIGALAVLIVAAAALAATFALTRGGTKDARDALLAKVPMAKLVGHDPDAPPGAKGDPDAAKTAKDSATGTANLGSPASYQEQQLRNLAYPADQITASQINGVRNAYMNHYNSSHATNAASWNLVGPTTSTQPGVLNAFDGFVANDFTGSDYQVSGRVTALAVNTSTCNNTTCQVWMAAAGGGIWENDNALDPNSPWNYESSTFASNNIGTIVYNARNHTLYAGTGEPNASADSGAGFGIYVSRNLGKSWSALPGNSVFTDRSISSIAIDPTSPNTFYVGSTRGAHGVSGTTGGVITKVPGAPQVGLYKTTNGGRTFTLAWDGNGPADYGSGYRGINKIQIDSHGTIYAASFGEGIWRSLDGGADWEQVFAPAEFGNGSDRTEFALANDSGATRIYITDGGSDYYDDSGNFLGTTTGVYVGNNIDTAVAGDLTDGNGGGNPGYDEVDSPDYTSTQFAPYDNCEGQCWYDNFVYAPADGPGNPNGDIAYVGGSFDYAQNTYPGFLVWGGRAVLLTQDAGSTWTTQSTDNAGGDFPNTNYFDIHPDQHSFVTDPANPFLFFEGSDGGLVRSNGIEDNNAADFCPQSYGDWTTACNNMHQAVPDQLITLNAGLSTLQFQNVAVNPNYGCGPAHHHGTCSSVELIGGTQDNGTWLGASDNSSWNSTMYGDGGIATFDAPGGNGNFMMNEFYDQGTDVNFEGGDPTAWVVVGGPFYASGEGSEFYKPQISDTVNPGTFFVGLQSVWRTKDYGGNQSYLESNCPEFTTYANDPDCGDFVALGSSDGAGGPGTSGDLTRSALGSRSGGFISALARGNDSSTLWAATDQGRLFISTNADRASANLVGYYRLDTASQPTRSISSIVVDPNNPDKAWVSYDGFNSSTPSTPGHVFQVVFNPSTQTATWTNLDKNTGPLGDLPVTFLARDNSTGTLYAATDYTVLATKPSRTGVYSGSWTKAGLYGMPMVEVPWLAVDQTNHVLYAATHGRGIWSLALPGNTSG